MWPAHNNGSSLVHTTSTSGAKQRDTNAGLVQVAYAKDTHMRQTTVRTTKGWGGIRVTGELEKEIVSVVGRDEQGVVHGVEGDELDVVMGEEETKDKQRMGIIK